AAKDMDPNTTISTLSTRNRYEKQENISKDFLIIIRANPCSSVVKKIFADVFLFFIAVSGG
ncbi:MAG: hypothetical protein KJ919_13240, partial [Verrucomicrobia bacterium]|nr:hypothetical protein [Verrucomicrobiota bacterium]